MRSPSTRVLDNQVDLFVGTVARDADGGFAQATPLIPIGLGVPCSVQYVGVQEVIDQQNRVTNANMYQIFFGYLIRINPLDVVVWVEDTITHTMYVQNVSPSEAGRGGCFVVRAIEKT